MSKTPFFRGARPSNDKFPNAMRSGGLIFISGHVAVGEGGVVDSPDDVVAQADVIFERITQLLDLAGSDMRHVLKINAFLTNPDDYPAYNEARHRWFPVDPPASASVVVKSLVTPGIVLEVDGMAEVVEG